MAEVVVLLQPRDEIRALLAEVRAFVDASIHPLEPRMAAEGFAALAPDLEALRDEVRARGWWGPQIPRDLGGMGLSFLDHALLTEVLGRSPVGHYVFGCQAPDAGNLELLHLHASPEQHARWLVPLAAGRIRSCFAMTEPGRPGSNPTWLDTRAEVDGDHWVITGRKWFTTAADGATFAIVMAVTDPEAHPFARASMIIVPTDTAGFEHVRRIPVMGHAGSGWASHSELAFDGVRVPLTNLLGRRGAGFMMAQERLGPGRIHHCMRWMGIAERAFELMCARAATRQISPGKPLATRQNVQDWIAESRAGIDAARLYVQHTAHRIDTEGAEAARSQISAVKFFAADVLSKVVDRAIQVHGALGMTDDTPLAWFYAHERAAHLYDGPDEVHKALVARHALRPYGVDLGSRGNPR